jgi:cytochrome c oxidase subunit 4
MEKGAKHATHIGYATYVLIWLGLLVFTALTVAMAGFHLGPVSIFAVILVAATKSALVGNYFMHLKYERPLLRRMVFIVLFILALFIGLTFTDIAFR